MENSTTIIEEEDYNTQNNVKSNDSKNVSPHDSKAHEHHNLYPHIGLEFDSLGDVKNLYKAFAKEEGFGVRIRSTKPNSCMLVCSNAGQRVVNSDGNEESNAITRKGKKRCSTSRTSCEAPLLVSKARKRHKWTIIRFNGVHNHVMVSPKSVKYLRCHKKMSLAAKNLVEKFDQEGLPTGKVAAPFSGESTIQLTPISQKPGVVAQQRLHSNRQNVQRECRSNKLNHWAVLGGCSCYMNVINQSLTQAPICHVLSRSQTVEVFVPSKLRHLIEEIRSLQEHVDRLLHYAGLMPPMEELARVDSNRVEFPPPRCGWCEDQQGREASLATDSNSGCSVVQSQRRLTIETSDSSDINGDGLKLKHEKSENTKIMNKRVSRERLSE